MDREKSAHKTYRSSPGVHELITAIQLNALITYKGIVYHRKLFTDVPSTTTVPITPITFYSGARGGRKTRKPKKYRYNGVGDGNGGRSTSTKKQGTAQQQKTAAPKLYFIPRHTDNRTSGAQHQQL